MCDFFPENIHLCVIIRWCVTQAELLLEFFNKKVNKTTFLRYPYSDRDLLLQSIERVSLMTNLYHIMIFIRLLTYFKNGDFIVILDTNFKGYLTIHKE